MSKSIGLLTGLLSLLSVSSWSAAAANVEVNRYGHPVPQAYGEVRVVAPYHVPARILVIEAPQSHQRDWHRYCHQYAACGQSVRFVAVREYQQQRHWHQQKRQRHGRKYRHACDHHH